MDNSNMANLARRVCMSYQILAEHDAVIGLMVRFPKVA
jgi:hypothetical protein